MARVKIDILGNSQDFNDAMKGVKRSLEMVKGYIVTEFAAKGVEVISDLSKKCLEFGSDLTNSSRALGITIEQVQVLKHLAEESGVEYDKLAESIAKVSVLRDKALKGDKDALKSFSDLGIGKDKLQSENSMDILFKEIGSKVKGSNFNQIAGPLSDILGRGFNQMLPALKTNVDEVSDSMKSMGMIMDAETAISLKVLDTELQTVSNILITVFAPALVKSVRMIEDAISSLLHFTFPTDKEEESTTHKLGVGAVSGVLKAAFPSLTPLIDVAPTVADVAAKEYSPAAKFDKFLKAQDDQIAKLKADDDNAGKDITFAPKPNKPMMKHEKIYSDSLTSVGNMLGAGYQGIGQIDLQRQANNKLERIITELITTKNINKQMVDALKLNGAVSGFLSQF